MGWAKKKTKKKTKLALSLEVLNGHHLHPRSTFLNIGDRMITSVLNAIIRLAYNDRQDTHQPDNRSSTTYVTSKDTIVWTNLQCCCYVLSSATIYATMLPSGLEAPFTLTLNSPRSVFTLICVEEGRGTFPWVGVSYEGILRGPSTGSS